MNELIRSALAAEPSAVTKVSDLLKRLRVQCPELRPDELFVGLAGVYPMACVNSVAIIPGYKLA